MNRSGGKTVNPKVSHVFWLDRGTEANRGRAPSLKIIVILMSYSMFLKEVPRRLMLRTQEVGIISLTKRNHGCIQLDPLFLCSDPGPVIRSSLSSCCRGKATLKLLLPVFAFLIGQKGRKFGKITRCELAATGNSSLRLWGGQKAEHELRHIPSCGP